RIGQLEVWDVKLPSARRAGEPVHTPVPMGGMTLNPTGTRLFTSDFADGTIRRYDVTDAGVKPRGPLRQRLGEVWCLAVSPDGRWLGGTSKTGVVGVWDLHETEPRYHVVRAAVPGPSYCNLVFSPDSRTLYAVSEGERSAVYDLS